MKSCKCYDCTQGRDRREEIRRGGVVEESLPHLPPKKDTKKWCKGKVGREHVMEWLPYTLGDRIRYWRQTCMKCGKIFGWKFPFSIR